MSDSLVRIMQGYVTIALDQQKYVTMAVHLAKSIRYFDPTRPVCLIHDGRLQLGEQERKVFDDLVLLPPSPEYIGCANKLRIYDYVPYEESMYIDADCLLVRRDVDRHWRRASERGYFGITGEKRTTGIWNKTDIGQVCANLGIPYVVQMNSGAFYFKKGASAQAFFEKLLWLYTNHRNDISSIHQGRVGQYADEPLIGAAMGSLGVDPIDGAPEDGAWMVSTWRARKCRLNPAHEESYLEKPANFFFGIPLLPRNLVPHQPTFFHFIGLKPRHLYQTAVEFFNRAFSEGVSRTGRMPGIRS